MIVSLLSGTLMHIFDRAMLAHYSLTAMNAAALAQQAGNIILFPLLCFATIAEVFVGQFNGAKLFHKTSLPILQNVLFLMFCCVWVCPLAFKYCHWVISPPLYADGAPYFTVTLFIIPFQIIHSSLASFFVGTRRPNIILYSVLVANVMNVGFDWLFIFGAVDIIPAMGAKGAAIATLISTIVSAIILLYCFLSKYNAMYYNTRCANFDKHLLKKNIFLGLPFSFSYFIEMAIWVSIVNVLAAVSMEEATVQNVCVTILTFFLFIIDGLQKGAMALASNCIGAQKVHLLPALIKSVLKVSGGIGIIIALPLLVFPEITLQYVFNITAAPIVANFKSTFIILWLSLTFSVFSSSCFSGILSSGGDTKFVTYVKTSTMVFCVAIPVYIFFTFGAFTSFISWTLGFIHQIANGVCFYLRYRSGAWNHDIIVVKPPDAPSLYKVGNDG
ncbi:MAG: polysaccharide biosynthesis C-terminal domain-containing protein [Holosporales bacterium]|jgi:MATE family multidrug resistance protein|nr:polysaccharide biosynthesis C-terminal domain-containing protein [Holosporales bacterium]